METATPTTCRTQHAIQEGNGIGVDDAPDLLQMWGVESMQQHEEIRRGDKRLRANFRSTKARMCCSWLRLRWTGHIAI
jgi:hypothetical protein